MAGRGGAEVRASERERDGRGVRGREAERGNRRRKSSKGASGNLHKSLKGVSLPCFRANRQRERAVVWRSGWQLMTQPPQGTGATATAAPPPPPPSSGVHVRCAGCRMILTVGAGFREFACPSCHLPQMLPPELLNAVDPSPSPNPQTLPLPHPPHQHHHHQQQPFHLKPAHGIDPTKIQLPCANCKAILNVPHGLTRFRCPQCMADLAVDISKLNDLLPPPDEVNEVYSPHPSP